MSDNSTQAIVGAVVWIAFSILIALALVLTHAFVAAGDTFAASGALAFVLATAPIYFKLFE